MIKRPLSHLAKMLDASVLNMPEDQDPIINGVSIDSRTVKPGMLYIPLKGARADGHDFIAPVRQAGAAASLWAIDRIPYPNFIPLILVKDPQEAMQKLAKTYLSEVNPLTVGVTGSNGKTSTKDMAASILSEKYRTVKTQGNHNNEIGLPLTIFDLDDDTQAAVLEMGMENYGEIEFLCSIAPLDIAAITSIGSAHMENFGNRKNIAKAKCEILEGLKPGGTFIYDKTSGEIDEVLSEIQVPESVKQVSFSADENIPADLQIKGGILYLKDGIEFDASGFEKPLFVPAAGKHQAGNALCAAAVGKAAGLDEEQIQKGLSKTELTRMRSRLYPLKEGVILDDSYKSNPESAKAGIDTLMQIPADRHIAVMAGMLDLGPTEKELHEQTGKYAKEQGADLFIGYGGLGKIMAEGFGQPSVVFEDKNELIEYLRPLFDEKSAVLIKGSRAFAMDEVVNALLKGENTDEKN